MIVNHLAPRQLTRWLDMLHVGIESLAYENELVMLSNSGALCQVGLHHLHQFFHYVLWVPCYRFIIDVM